MRYYESGFTLVELLVVIATMGVLVMLAVPNYQKIKDQGYNAVVERTLQDSRTAIETGLGTLEETGLAASISVIQTNRKGNILDSDADDLVPGLKLPDYIRFMAYYNPNCADAGCTKHYVYVRHCRTRKTEYYLTNGGGTEFHVDYVSGTGC